jgi:hypothetical protein
MPDLAAPRGSKLVEFYAGRGTDFAGRTIDDVWRMSLDELESTHDYIQWLFPLRERSSVQPHVPVLDEATIRAFELPELRDRLLKSARIMARFYGLEIVENDGGVVVGRSRDFDARRKNWLTPGNHNFLRLTRILKSLATLGHEALSRAWLGALTAVYDDYSGIIGARTFDYWRGAVSSDGS